MKNLVPFSKGSLANHDEMHLLEKIRVLANRYAEGETASLLIVLTAYTKINGPARKLCRILDLTPVAYAQALAAATIRLREDQEFNALFHCIRSGAEDAEVTIPRFPASPPYQ